jgi:ABC-type glutathione transport system ATPase component
MNQSLLEVRDLKIAFSGQDGRRTQAVDGVSFSVEAG